MTYLKSQRIFIWVVGYFFIQIPVYAQPNDPLPDTLKIVAIRVDFRSDNSLLTNGTGSFNTAVISTPDYFIDPPPHNRNYFEKHLEAVTNYFQSVSRSQAPVFSYQVFPTSLDSAYHLP